MDKKIKPIVKTTIKDIENNKRELERILSTFDILITEQKTYIKHCQDAGLADDFIEHEIDFLSKLTETHEKALNGIYDINEILEKAKELKNG